MAAFWHDEDLVPIVPEDGTPPNLIEGFEAGDQIGNPLYTVADEHALAILLLLAMPLLGWLLARMIRWYAGRGSGWAQRLVAGYDVLPTPRRWAAWAIATSAILHLLLAVTHEPSAFNAMYLAGAILLAGAARWVVLDEHRRGTALVVVASVVAFWFFGSPPDQVGIVTKLLELLALALLAVPEPGVRRRFGPTGVVSLIVLTGIASWVGAFASAGEQGGHHGGEFPEPGTVVPYIERLEATADEQAAAEALYAEIKVALAKYEDVVVAEADGYNVGSVVGRSHHADNPAYLDDGRILDPNRPETLVYAASKDGPVLLGAMFQMPGLNNPGPRIGGPLTVWHSHENVCISLTPPSLTGLLSPFGSCPVGAFNIARTNEMIHAWTLPGVEDEWGHIEDEWLDEYLSSSHDRAELP